MQGSIQLLQISTEQLQEIISAVVKPHLEELKKEFQPKEPTELLTRKEVSELLKVNLTTVHFWSKSGKLKRHGIGNRVYYKRSEIEESLISLK
ncbi:helix-turn-helix domain-containing protein [Salinimicrobium sp. WS361]|uniref:helix-turn-helix domain-containing protein n=1 Tax=Salinimicrobium sp. WS361 TaxID=3425123 RepID=UPI003D6F79A8